MSNLTIVKQDNVTVYVIPPKVEVDTTQAKHGFVRVHVEPTQYWIATKPTK